MWESHADTGARGIVKPAPERALPVYAVNKLACVPADQVLVAVTAPLVGLGDIEALLRRLFPTAPVQTLLLRPVPTEMEILLERLLSGARLWEKDSSIVSKKTKYVHLCHWKYH